MQKPHQSDWGLLAISFGNFGTAIAFALQGANMARIFQTLGAELDSLAILMIAGPVTGLLVQPLVGHYSDRTWGRWGRRRPYFLGGAICSALALVAMPYAQWLWLAAILLWILDAALNVAIEPFRAFVADMVPEAQRARGFAFNTMLGCTGAIIGSIAPYLIAATGVPNTAPPGEIPPSVQLSFWLAAFALLAAMGWTIWRTREYSPAEMAAFDQADAKPPAPTAIAYPAGGGWWMVSGMVLTAVLALTRQDVLLYVISIGLILFGLMQIVNQRWQSTHVIAHILSDLAQMPAIMKRLAVAHFLTWFALFIMWPFMTPVITQRVFGATDSTSAAYNAGADWVGLLFGAYNAAAAIAALLLLPKLAARIGPAMTHMAGLAIGAASFAAVMLVRDPYWMILPFVGLGIAWASLLTMPYVLLTGALPPSKLGVYMGIFNLFIVLPQILVAAVMGGLLRSWFPGEPVWTMAFAAAAMALAALAMLWVRRCPADSQSQSIA